MLWLGLISCTLSISAVDIPLIFPVPREQKVTNDVFTVDETISVLVPVNAVEQDILLARSIIRELSDKYGVAVKLATANDLPSKGKIILMGSQSNILIREYCRRNNLLLTGEKPGKEGYILHVKNDIIVVAGQDDQGAFYGLQSLRQLLIRGNGKKVQGIEVTDWPVMPFRGIRLYVPGPENIAFYKRFIRDFMALYKYNKVIVEVNCMRLDRCLFY
ncbi:MAG: hypothetical protein HZB98_07270 [Bacteroidia bacterium]|nr:hypothetical protein [Bacteroidia bacterium]